MQILLTLPVHVVCCLDRRLHYVRHGSRLHTPSIARRPSGVMDHVFLLSRR